MSSQRIEEKAKQFIQNEKEFRLGSLVTEQSHHLTANLSEKIATSTSAGLQNLLEVDYATLPYLEAFFQSSQFTDLQNDMRDTIQSGGRIFFTGCGATGRLSILLESAWREFWMNHQTKRDLKDRVISIMAGGDYALIKSVEGFEDFQEFGKKQIHDHGLNSNDMVVAITEGGETSFVIGTAWAGVETKCTTWMIYNNPTEQLLEKVSRSRDILNCPDVKNFCLCTGPMAIAGSTRMQATSIELLIIGSALENTIYTLLGNNTVLPEKYTQTYKKLLEEIGDIKNLNTLSTFTEAETKLFQLSGLVTYFANNSSIDLLTDTTERSPTFSIPPFRKSTETHLPDPFCFLKHPIYNTSQAWEFLLKRKIRGIDWCKNQYEKLNAPALLTKNPPDLSADSIKSYPIGNEQDDSRYNKKYNQASIVLIQSDLMNKDLEIKLLDSISVYNQKNTLFIGKKNTATQLPNIHPIDIEINDSPLRLWEHLATKIILNVHSTASMTLAGRVKGNWMIHVQATNKKLIDRATRLIADLAGIDYATACHQLHIAMDKIAKLPSDAPKPSPAWYVLHQYDALE